MAATAGTATVTSTTSELIWEDTNGATAVTFHALSAGVSINIPGLHADGDWHPLKANEHHTYRMWHMGIKKVYAKVGSGSHDVEYGTLEKSTSMLS